VFVARDENMNPVGFVALYENQALYAGGAFGTIPEFYVRPKFRRGGLGNQLLERAKAFAKARGWTRKRNP
jgi:GNAT superfamily N-acetyltransferase